MASGDTLTVFHPLNYEPPSASVATFNTRNAHIVLEFPSGSNFYANFGGVLPRNYSGGGITAVYIWLSAISASGSAVWGGAWERHQDDTTDLDADSFAAAQTTAFTCADACGEPSYDALTFTDGAQMDSLAVGESFRFQVSRMGSSASESMGGIAQLLRVEIRET